MVKRTTDGSSLAVSPAGDDAGSDSKAAQTKARILDAAARVLSVKGYAGLRLTDVAEVAELQAPAIYYYYPSRDDLIEEVMWAGIADTRQHVADVLERCHRTARRMDRMLAGRRGASAAHTGNIRLRHGVDPQRRSGPAEDPQATDPGGRALRRDLAPAGQRHGPLGELRDDLDLYVAQMLVLGALNWSTEWWNPRRGSLEASSPTRRVLVRSGLGPACAAPMDGARQRSCRRRSRPSRRTRWCRRWRTP